MLADRESAAATSRQLQPGAGRSPASGGAAVGKDVVSGTLIVVKPTTVTKAVDKYVQIPP